MRYIDIIAISLFVLEPFHPSSRRLPRLCLNTPVSSWSLKRLATECLDVKCMEVSRFCPSKPHVIYHLCMALSAIDTDACYLCNNQLKFLCLWNRVWRRCIVQQHGGFSPPYDVALLTKNGLNLII